MKELKGMSIGAIAMITLAVSALIGVSIIDNIGDLQKVNTAYLNDSFTGNNVTAQSLDFDEIVTTEAYRVRNTTNHNLTLTTDYTLNAKLGKVLIVNDTFNGVALEADYTYRADTDVTTSAALFKAGLVVFATFSGLVSLILVGMILLNLLRKSDGY